MAKYLVNVKEIITNSLIVEADSYEEAEKYVKAANDLGFIDLTEMMSTEYETIYTDMTVENNNMLAALYDIVNEHESISRFRKYLTRNNQTIDELMEV